MPFKRNSTIAGWILKLSPRKKIAVVPSASPVAPVAPSESTSSRPTTSGQSITREDLEDLVKHLDALRLSKNIDTFFNSIRLVYSKLPRPALDAPPATPVVSTSLVNTKDYIFNLVWFNITELHRSRPTHPMFGPCEKGKIRAPFFLPGGKGAATSWHKKVQHLAGNVAKCMGNWIPENSCWMVKEDSTHISSKGGMLSRLVTYKTYRWLAFVANPTEENWGYLTGELEGKGKSRDVPFLHYCHNGHSSQDKRKALGCVNGYQHGFFGSAVENNKQRECRGRSRATCPGHNGGYCVYVHENGWPRPCLNLTETPVVCSCPGRLCF